MRPLHLQVQGFMAFKGHQDIDFAGLDLFAIVGPTGSGKSALLDAMTFALYGRTPRLGATDLEALISTSEQGTSVSLEFEVRGERYRVARSRGRKASGNQVSLEQEVEGRWKPLAANRASDTTARIAQAVGLDYAAFTRAVLLPQGEFSAFLRGTGRDRQRLLGELTNLGEVGRMAGFARDRSRELTLRLAGLHTLLDNEYADISLELLAGWERELEAVHSRAENLSERRDELALALTRLRELAAAWTQHQKVRGELAGLDARAGEVLEGAGRAASARQVAGVLPLLSASERAAAASARAAAELERLEVGASSAERALGVAGLKLGAAEESAARIPGQEARAEGLREAEGLARRLRLAGGRPQTSHPRPLPWDEEEHQRASEGAEKGRTLRLERVQLEAERVALERRQADQRLARAQQEAETRDLERLKAEGMRGKEALEGARAQLVEAEALAGVRRHRPLLHLHEPCPLCEQTVRELPADRADELTAEVERLGLEVQRLDGSLNVLRERCTGLLVSTRARALGLGEEERRLAEEGSHLHARDAELRVSEAALGQDFPADPQDLAARLLAGLAGQVRGAGDDPAAQRQRLLEEIAGLRRGLDEARAAQGRQQAAHAAARATLEAARAGAADRLQEAAEAAHAAAGMLEALRLSEAQARAQALSEAAILALEAAARQHEERRRGLQAEVSELERRLGGRTFDPSRLSAAERELSGTETELKSCREQAGRLQEGLRAGRGRLQRKEALETETHELAATLDTWKTLAGSLGVSEFQQYLLQEVESRLLSGAGQLLHEISDSRYRLELQEGDYVVRDLWNAGETRGVRTLSGGETFLASLSLAIALSDYLAGNRVLGALFLDEGFGTLDPQALEAVAGALENLRTGGRMVGVITHIESLSDRLPHRLLVSKSAAGSSVQRLES